MTDDFFSCVAAEEEGIYRLSGSAKTIQALRDRFNNGLFAGPFGFGFLMNP